MFIMQRKRLVKSMRKFMLIILISILVIGCSKDRSKVTAESMNGAGQVPYETQSSIVTQTPSPEETLKSQYPKILTPVSVNQIDHAVNSEGVFCIYDGKKYGYMDDSGNEITPYIYNYAYPFSEGLACVRHGKKYGFINDKGDTVIPLVYDKAGPFSEGLAYFEEGDKYGFIDKSGKVVFILNCDSVGSFKEGLAYFSDGGKYGFIDETGKVVIKPVYDDVNYFQDGLAKVRLGLKLGIIDKNGTVIVPVDYDEISFDSGFIITKLGGKYGCFDKNGNLIFKPVYDEISMLQGEDSAIVYQGDQPEIVDLKGNIEVSAKYDSIAYHGNKNSDGMIEVRKNNKVGFLDMYDFLEVIPPVYNWASFFTKGHVVVEIRNKYGVIDKNGNTVVPLKYDYIEMFKNGTLALEQGDKYELADVNGSVINSSRYDSINEIGSCYIVEVDDKYGLLDESGAEVVAPIYDYIATGEYNNIYNSANCCVATTYGSKSKDCIIETGQDKDTDLSCLLLQNEITPRIKSFNHYQRSGSIKISGEDYKTMTISISDDMNDCYKEFKLYDVDESGNPVLYFYAQSLIREGPGILSYSGLYSVKNGSLNKLVTGYECGGSMGGNAVSFFKDTKTSKILIGDSSHAGGFMGNAYGNDIYEYRNGEAKEIVSYLCINQSAGNYDKKDLIKKANLFYDDNDKPYNKHLILHADYVTEYRLGDKQVSVKTYNKNANRYEILLFFHSDVMIDTG